MISLINFLIDCHLRIIEPLLFIFELEIFNFIKKNAIKTIKRVQYY